MHRLSRLIGNKWIFKKSHKKLIKFSSNINVKKGIKISGYTHLKTIYS